MYYNLNIQNLLNNANDDDVKYILQNSDNIYTISDINKWLINIHKYNSIINKNVNYFEKYEDKFNQQYISYLIEKRINNNVLFFDWSNTYTSDFNFISNNEINNFNNKIKYYMKKFNKVNLELECRFGYFNKNNAFVPYISKFYFDVLLQYAYKNMNFINKDIFNITQYNNNIQKRENVNTNQVCYRLKNKLYYYDNKTYQFRIVLSLEKYFSNVNDNIINDMFKKIVYNFHFNNHVLISFHKFIDKYYIECELLNNLLTIDSTIMFTKYVKHMLSLLNNTYIIPKNYDVFIKYKSKLEHILKNIHIKHAINYDYSNINFKTYYFYTYKIDGYNVFLIILDNIGFVINKRLFYNNLSFSDIFIYPFKLNVNNSVFEGEMFKNIIYIHNIYKYNNELTLEYDFSQKIKIFLTMDNTVFLKTKHFFKNINDYFNFEKNENDLDLDGIIFQPNDHKSNILKWKELNNTTIDFLFIKNYLKQNYYSLYLQNNIYIMDIFVNNDELDNEICECKYDLELKNWIFVKIRYDKIKPNNIHTYNNIIYNLNNIVPKDVLINRNCNIIYLKKIHNIIKKKIINEYINDNDYNILDVGCGKGGDFNKYKKYKYITFLEKDDNNISEFMDRYDIKSKRNPDYEIVNNSFEDFKICIKYDVCVFFFSFSFFNLNDAIDKINIINPKLVIITILNNSNILNNKSYIIYPDDDNWFFKIKKLKDDKVYINIKDTIVNDYTENLIYINDIINIFEKNNYSLIENTKTIDHCDINILNYVEQLLANETHFIVFNKC